MYTYLVYVILPDSIPAFIVCLKLKKNYIIANWYLGCYVDSNPNRDLSGISETLNQNTVESCVALCRLNSFTYAGLQFK